MRNVIRHEDPGPRERNRCLSSLASPWRGIWRDIGRCWKSLALTDIAYKIMAFVVLTPLLAFLFRSLIALSGRTVLADEDILYFLLEPLGWLCLILVGGLFLGVVAWELAALMGILGAAAEGQTWSVWEALQFAAVRAWPVVHVAGRIVAWTLVVAAPFLLVAGMLYVSLLTQFDINYYLAEKPPVFWFAVTTGSLLALILLVTLLGLYAGWLFALPLVLFEEVSPKRALRTSRHRTRGYRRTLLIGLVVWLLGTTMLSAAVTALVVRLGQEVLPLVVRSFALLPFLVGVLLVLWGASGLAVNLLSTITFAAMLYHFYREAGGTTAGLAPQSAKARIPGFELTRTRFVTVAVLGVLVAVTVGFAAIQTLTVDDRTQVTAHRGSSAAAPENTLAAVRRAIADTADWVEIDVQETADGEVVVFHDSDFQKVAGRDLKIWDATLADLQQIDIGSHFAPEFSAERVPTLGQVLDLCRGKIGVNIELKYYGHDQQLEQRVAELVEAHEMTEHVVIMSLKKQGIARMKSLRPSWKVGLLTAVAVGDVTRLEADFFAVSARLGTWGFVRAAHRRGKEVHVWTVNDPLTMSTMTTRGVDCLITDKPALARSVLRQRRELNTAERLLLALGSVFDVIEESDGP